MLSIFHPPTLYFKDNRPGPGVRMPIWIIDKISLFAHLERLPPPAAFAAISNITHVDTPRSDGQFLTKDFQGFLKFLKIKNGNGLVVTSKGMAVKPQTR